MFTELMESERKVRRGFSGVLLSFILHFCFVGLAIASGTNVVAQFRKPEEHTLRIMEVAKEKPPQVMPATVSKNFEQPAIVKGFQILLAPIEIPNVLPDIDLSKTITNEADFSGKGMAGGIEKGSINGRVMERTSDNSGEVIPLSVNQVEKAVQILPGGSSPRYPDILRQAGVEGEVLAQFVVDTTGHVETTSFRVLKSSHELFSIAVKQALQGMRFLPAEVGGRKVRQLVEQPFSFSITR